MRRRSAFFGVQYVRAGPAPTPTSCARVKKPRGGPTPTAHAGLRCCPMQPNGTKVVRPPNRVTIREAATLLNVHPNTVRHRVKVGTYKAEKVVTDKGPTWMLDRDSFITNTPTRGSQQAGEVVGGKNLAVVQELLRPFVEELGRVREDLGTERVRREQAERERDELAAELAALRGAREAHETTAEGSGGVDDPRPADKGAQEAVERRSNWLYRFFFGE